MALVLADRVLETTTTTGSGTITLAGAEPGYQSFAVVGNGNETYYTIAGDTEWEVGIGTYTSSGTTLSRDTVLSSSNSGNKVTFSAGVKKVFVTYPSEKSVNRNVSGDITAASGRIINLGAPISQSDATTKEYVDQLAIGGVHYHTPVQYEVPNTTGNLNATYNQPGGAGVGVSATLTNAGSLVPFVPDGVTASISDRVLVYNQTNAYENGVYVVTTVGDGSTAWVLTRASDADTYAPSDPNSLGEGDAFFVTSGDTGAGETYVCNTEGTISFGSTAISFVQVSAARVYQAGNGISITNSTISLATPVSVANGGTGQSTTPTNGQLLIGNGTSFVLSTLTAGSGVSITNSAGGITLSATNSGAVTSVTATGPLASSGGATPDISIANSTGTGSVVLDQGATISSATITAAVSASITTITGSSANITTVTGTTAGFSSANITQLGTTSATIATLSGTNVTYSSGTVSQLAATSATIASVSGTNVTYSNGNFTSATITTASGTNLSYGSLTLSSGANITGNVGIGKTPTTALDVSGTITGTTGAFTNLSVTNTISGSISGNAATATTASNVNNGTLTMNVSGTGLSGSQTFTANQSGNATFTVTSNATSANTLSTIVARDSGTGGFIAGDITALRPAAPTTGVIFFGNTGGRYLYYDGTNYSMPNGELYVSGSQVVKNNGGNWNVNAVGIYSTQPTLGYVASGQSIAYTAQLGPQIMGQGGSAAAITFHRPGAYAINLGLDTDNVVKIGGWSAGAVAYPILTSNNYSSYISGSSLKSQTFTSSGTFTVPTGITSVWVTMIGGGGSGQAAIAFNFSAGGGAGAYCIKRAVSVTAGAGITVTIGAGGAGAGASLSANTPGNDGSATSFGSVSVSGGSGAKIDGNAGAPGGGGANGGQAGFGNNYSAVPAGSVGGRSGQTAFGSGNPAAGGGAGGLFGNGTDGVSGGASSAAAANSGAGSGGSRSTSGTTFASGGGGSGMVIVEWLG